MSETGGSEVQIDETKTSQYEFLKSPNEAVERERLIQDVFVDEIGMAHCANADYRMDAVLGAVTIDSDGNAHRVPFQINKDHILQLPLPGDNTTRFGFFVLGPQMPKLNKDESLKQSIVMRLGEGAETIPLSAVMDRELKYPLSSDEDQEEVKNWAQQAFEATQVTSRRDPIIIIDRKTKEPREVFSERRIPFLSPKYSNRRGIFSKEQHTLLPDLSLHVLLDKSPFISTLDGLQDVDKTIDHNKIKMDSLEVLIFNQEPTLNLPELPRLRGVGIGFGDPQGKLTMLPDGWAAPVNALVSMFKVKLVPAES